MTKGKTTIKKNNNNKKELSQNDKLPTDDVENTISTYLGGDLRVAKDSFLRKGKDAASRPDVEKS